MHFHIQSDIIYILRGGSKVMYTSWLVTFVCVQGTVSREQQYTHLVPGTEVTTYTGYQFTHLMAYRLLSIPTPPDECVKQSKINNHHSCLTNIIHVYHTGVSIVVMSVLIIYIHSLF